MALFESKEKQLPAVRQQDRRTERSEAGCAGSDSTYRALDVARRLERDFYRDLSSVLRKWRKIWHPRREQAAKGRRDCGGDRVVA